MVEKLGHKPRRRKSGEQPEDTQQQRLKLVLGELVEVLNRLQRPMPPNMGIRFSFDGQPAMFYDITLPEDDQETGLWENGRERPPANATKPVQLAFNFADAVKNALVDR